MPLLEEIDYYPFGLAMSGISSKAAGGLENRSKFNDGTDLENKEFSDGSGLELYSTDFRSYDPQIGRFHQIDPLGEVTDNWSPYSFVQNNPLLYNDPLGLDTLKQTGQKTAEGEIIWTGQNNEQNENNTVVVKSGTKTNSSGNNSEATENNNSGSSDNVTPTPAPTPTPTPGPNNRRLFDTHDAKKGLRVVYNEFGKEMAANVERMYRLETNHFRSSQYTHTGTGGMEAHGPAPCYGWTSTFFNGLPTGLYLIHENKGLSGIGGNAQITSRPKQFVIMPTVAATMMFKANYIQGHNGNYARWFSTNQQAQALYRTKIQAITPKIVNGF